MQNTSIIMSLTKYALLAALSWPTYCIEAQSAEDGKPLPSSLAWYASIAKARGQKEISIVSMESHDYTPPLDRTAQNSLLLRGSIAAAIISSDGFHIYQWYRIKVISRGHTNPSRETAVLSDIPASLGPLQSDDVILRIPGGTELVDGVAVTQDGPSPLTVGQTYLLFAVPTNGPFYHLSLNTHPIPLDATGHLLSTKEHPSTFDRQMEGFALYDDVDKTISHLPSR